MLSSTADAGGCGILALVREYEEQQEACALHKGEDVVVVAAEDFLQRLLSELAQLADVPAVAAAVSSQAAASAEESSQHQQDDELLPTMADQIWNVLLGQETTLSSMAINHTHQALAEKKQAATEQQRLRTRWEQGLRLASRLVLGTGGNNGNSPISATELHAVAASSIVFARSNDDDNDDSMMFRTTCLLLCCRALRQCPTPSIEQRWRRWQSLLLETVRLFQQHVLGRISIRSTKNDANLAVSSSLDVACRHLLPALAHVQQALMLSTTISSSSTTSGEGDPPPPPPRWMVLEAGTVWCVARLAVLVVAATNNNNNNSDAATARAKKQLRALLVADDRHILGGRYELLYEHPWWRWRREPTQDDERPGTTTMNSTSPSSPSSSAAAAVLAYYTTDLVVDDSAEAEEERRDEVLGLQTVWSDLGIAILAAAVGWTERPNVWTVEYQWRMFFPHVAVLLLAQDDDDDDNEDQFGGCYDEGENAAAEGFDSEDDSSDGIDTCSSLIVAARLLGFDLLHNLLQQTPDRSAITPDSRHAPDCPIGTLQLIANQIIVSSGSELGQASGWGTLPNASRSFQWMRSLVGKYCPAYQVTIVQTLYQDCPHPGLRPKIIDLLRSFVAWEDESAVHDVWLFLDVQVLSSLASHVGGAFPTNNGPMDVSSWSSVEELVNHVEVYSAALGLIQLWLLCVRKAPTTTAVATTFTDDLEQRLASIHGRVQQIIAAITAEQQHSTNAAPSTVPAEHHRLHLLESALKQTVELLAGLSQTSEMGKQ